jgi:chorismate-pyruvate lyase
VDESLASLTDPLLRGLVREIRRILVHPDLGIDQKLIAVAGAVDGMAPPPGPSPATRLAMVMRRGSKPFTLLAAEAAGEEVRVKLNRTEDRPPDDRERRLLGRPGKVQGRAGSLYLPGSGMVIAQVTSVVVPFRLDPYARADLSAGKVPLGQVLAALPGARRETLEARETSDGRVLSSARMHAGGWPVALATEVVTAEFAALAGERLP